MACLIAPAAAALITTSIKKKIPHGYHLEWLNAMLWGGVIMLTVEHIAHQEIVSYPPFLTAMQNSADTAVMIQEISTIGAAMTLAVFLVWGSMVFISAKLAKLNSRKNLLAKA